MQACSGIKSEVSAATQVCMSHRTHLDLMFPLLIYPFLCLGTLFVILHFANDCLDFYLGQGTRESGVKGKLIIGTDFAALGMLRQYPELPASEGLQTSCKIVVRNLRGRFDILRKSSYQYSARAKSLYRIVGRWTNLKA